MTIPLPPLDPLSADERAVISAVVDQAPPLTQSARAKLAALLSGAGKTDRFTESLRAPVQAGPQ